MATHATLKSIVHHILGLQASRFEQLQLIPGSMSVVHFSSQNSTPVLQAMHTMSIMDF